MSKMQSTMVPLNTHTGDRTGTETVRVSIQEPPSDYAVWSIASIFYGNPFCLGLIAYHFSIKARDRKLVGDNAGAKTYASKAYCYNIISLALIILFTLVSIVTIVICANTRIIAGSYL